MAHLACETKDMGFQLEQVQGFTPTPMTVATVIYYTGVHPYTLRPVYTAKSPKEKRAQHLFFFWYKQENRGRIRARLEQLGRNDMADKLLAQPQKEKPGKKKNGFGSGKRIGKSRPSGWRSRKNKTRRR